VAKKLLSEGKKQQALIALKKKKLQEVHLARSQAQLDNVSTLIDSVEFAQIEVKVFDALKAGNVALGQLHDAIGGVEAVEELLLDTEDAIARQNEIEEVYDIKFICVRPPRSLLSLSSSLGQSMAAEQIDEDEILAELDALEVAEAGLDNLPNVPRHELPTKEPLDATAAAAKAKAKAKPATQKQAVLA
jgi:hypothetical protein